MYRILIAFLTLLTPLAMFAQATPDVSGKLIDSKTKEPLSYVTVALIPKGSNTPINGVNTDDDGFFTSRT